jgi:hypothetical protein
MDTPMPSGRLLGGRYRVGEAIGHGGMSTVYRALDERLGRPVALKVIRYPVGAEHLRGHLRERFRREAASAARIPPHPNVVQVYDYGTDPDLDLDYIVMELLRGRDLKAALRHAAFALSPIDVLLQAARGLAAGHRVGLVHRDVKPSNLFLVGEERLEAVRILDFGIAKAFEDEDEDDLTRLGGIPYTPAYTSPEQRDPGRRLTPASDVYQLGLVAYELLAGDRPYDAEERERIQRGEDVPLPVRGRWNQVSPALRGVVERALRGDPRARFPDGAALAEALAKVEDEAEHDDRTLLAEPAPAVENSATLHAPPREAPPAASLEPAPPPSGTGPRFRRMRRWLPGSGHLRVGLGVLLAAFLFWGLFKWANPTPSVPLAGRRSVEELEAEFEPLYRAASARLAEEADEPTEAESAARVRQVIRDANEAWERGEMERHLAHYAERVRVDGEEVGREELGRAREEERSLYDDVEITAEPQRIEFPEPGRARARVNRSWRYVGETARREGEAQQVLTLELQDDRWIIVAEEPAPMNASGPER